MVEGNRGYLSCSEFASAFKLCCDWELVKLKNLILIVLVGETRESQGAVAFVSVASWSIDTSLNS